MVFRDICEPFQVIFTWNYFRVMVKSLTSSTITDSLLRTSGTQARGLANLRQQEEAPKDPICDGTRKIASIELQLALNG
jgi:hypothetical protein